MASAVEERSRGPMLRSIAAFVIILAAGLLGTAIAYRQSIAEALLLRQLRSLGLDEAVLSVGRFDAGWLELENLSIGTGDGLEIARIDAHFSTRGLLASRLDALQISGVRLRGTLGPSGISFGPLDRIFERKPASAQPSGPVTLPAAGISIDDAELELATAKGPLQASLELQAIETAPEQLEAEARLQLHHALANVDAHLSAAGSPVSLTGDLEIGASAAGNFTASTSARAVSLAAKAVFDFEAGEVTIQPLDCVAIQIEGLTLKPLLAFSKSLDLCLRSRSESGIRIAREGSVETNLELVPAAFAAELEIGAESQRVSGELPRLWLRTVERDGEFEASLATEVGRLEFAKPAIVIRDIRLEASASRNAVLPQGQLRIGEIFDTRKPARFPKLALSARFAPRDDELDFELEFANSSRAFVIEIDGVHDFARAAGRADLHLHPIDFEPGQLQPSTLFPVLSHLLTEASGSIEIKGSGEWDARGTRGTVEVAVIDASATSELATIEHLNAIAELNETGATSLDQTISIGRLDFGLELTDGLIHYRIKPGGIVEIKTVSWKFAGGELTTRGEIDPRSANQAISLLVKSVDLARLFELVNLKGLSGSGTLDGEFPLALVENAIEIRNAVLRSSGGPGIIQYRPNPGTSNIAKADTQFSTVLDVLENFHYERIEIEINGSATGTVLIKIHLAGSNPDYQAGHPVEFNLSLDARLSDLLKTEARIYQMPKKIEERLEAFTERTP